MPAPSGTLIEVARGDALKFNADVLVLKYARNLYGVDQAVHVRLTSAGIDVTLPAIGKYASLHTRGALATQTVLFLGVPPLAHFDYSQLREFGRRAIETVAGQMPKAAHVALTIHGPGYGLDEIEAFESQLAGVLDALDALGRTAIRKVTFVERSAGRADRLATALARLLPQSALPSGSAGGLRSLGEDARATLRSVGYSSASKPRAFVAMPFAPEHDDVFHYGIQGASNAAGLLCERADLSSFTGDVMAWVKDRISTAKVLIADLSSANPNVYLEVGYAWGRGVPTVLVCKDASTDLKFDVRGQRCLVYKNIKHLEEMLSRELQALFPN